MANSVFSTHKQSSLKHLVSLLDDKSSQYPRAIRTMTRGLRRRIVALALLSLILTCGTKTASAQPQPAAGSSATAFLATLISLPAIDGDLSGDALLFSAPDAPDSALQIHWRVIAESPGQTPRLRCAKIELTGAGAHVVLHAELDLKTGVTHWKIESAQADLAETFPILAPRFLPDFAYLDVSGKFILTGTGALDASGKITGAVSAEIQDAAVTDVVRGWHAEGLSTRIELPAFPSLRTAGAQPLAMRHFVHNATALALDNLQTAVTVSENTSGQLSVHTSNIKANAAKGLVDIDSFDFTPGAPAVTTVIHVADIDSTTLAKMLPDAISEVHGRFSGAVTLHWSPNEGLKPGVGQLSLQKAGGSSLRMAGAPGLFTASMDQRLYFLPGSLGFLRRILSIKNPAYDTLKQIEEGKQPIIVDNITINFTPDGDAAGRSASVVIEARPANPQSAIQHLRINVNVSGPLVKVIEMSTTDKLNISF